VCGQPADFRPKYSPLGNGDNVFGGCGVWSGMTFQFNPSDIDDASEIFGKIVMQLISSA